MALNKVDLCGVDTSKLPVLTNAQMQALFARIADPALLVRRLNLTACRIGPADQAGRSVQLSFFDGEDAARRAAERREERRQRAVLAIREKYGGNAIFRGADLLEGATGLSRNAQIGGHRA